MEKKSPLCKWEFVGALYKYGSNPKILQKALPHWSSAKIESFIKSYRLRAERKLQASRKLDISDDEPIDLWLDFVSNCHTIDGSRNFIVPKSERRRRGKPRREQSTNDYSFLLSKSMMYAAYFEEHFQSKNPDEPNYSEIYRYFSQLLAGEEPVQLRPGNAAKILEMISKLKEVMDNTENTQRYLSYLTNQHKVSFIKLGVDPSAVAEDKWENTSANQSAADQQFQAFMNSCHHKDLDLVNLNENDKDYDAKRKANNLKLALKQRAIAKTLIHIPGLNPMEMPAESLVKPENVIIKPVARKRKRISVTKEDEDFV